MRSHPTASDDLNAEAEVAQLLRQGALRPPVPEEVLEGARVAAEAEWRQVVMRRRRTRRRAWTAGLAVAASLAWWWTGASLVDLQRWVSGPEPAIVMGPALGPVGDAVRLEIALGQVLWSAGDGTPARPLKVGERLPPGGWLSTSGESRAALRLAHGQSLRLDHGTRLQLISATELELETGAIYVDSESRASLAIHTPWGIARDLGTQFEVRIAEQELQLRVREGKVLLAAEDAEHEATPGTELVVDVRGRTSVGEVAVFGQAWDWSLDVAPPFSLEGSTLDDFLSWIVRENGWRLRFADPSLEAQVGQTVLHGSLDDVPVASAVSMVLATCGLEHSIDDGVLMVVRP